MFEFTDFCILVNVNTIRDIEHVNMILNVYVLHMEYSGILLNLSKLRLVGSCSCLLELL